MRVWWFRQILLSSMVIGWGMVSACAAVPESTKTGDIISAGEENADGGKLAGIPTAAVIPKSTALNVTTASMKKIPFKIVAEGEPLVGQEQNPITLAIRAHDLNPAIPETLPDMAKESLQTFLARPDPAIYIVIYAGMQPSSGYRVVIDSITARSEAGREEWVVNYAIKRPEGIQGGAAVLTYPFIIARVSRTGKQVDKILFKKL